MSRVYIPTPRVLPEVVPVDPRTYEENHDSKRGRTIRITGREIEERQEPQDLPNVRGREQPAQIRRTGTIREESGADAGRQRRISNRQVSGVARRSMSAWA